MTILNTVWTIVNELQIVIGISRILDLFFSEISWTWKVLQHEIGPEKLKCRVLESAGIFNCGAY